MDVPSDAATNARQLCHYKIATTNEMRNLAWSVFYEKTIQITWFALNSGKGCTFFSPFRKILALQYIETETHKVVRKMILLWDMNWWQKYLKYCFGLLFVLPLLLSWNTKVTTWCRIALGFRAWCIFLFLCSYQKHLWCKIFWGGKSC